MKRTIVALFILNCISNLNAQIDTAKVDTVHFRNGSIMLGKLTFVRTQTVDFVEMENSLQYELKKGDIELIALSTGNHLVFEEEKNTEGERSVALVAVCVTAAAILVYAIISSNARH